MIEVKNLCFSYTDKAFIENINFEVRKGEIMGFLGPSGAGKSTLQKILTGILTSYSGNATIKGMEIKNHKKDFYEDIGVDFEFSSLYEKFSAIDNLKYFSSLYRKTPLDIDMLLDKVGLSNDGNKKVSEYSKGMKSRLNFIKALIHKPEIIFLDEPTNGLDPTNARLMKNIIKSLKSEGKTIILTTHNMMDATELCDNVAFIVEGKIKALDTPHNFMMKKQSYMIRYSYKVEGEEIIREIPHDSTGSDKTLQELIKNNKLLSIHSMQPTLEDIFIEIAGRSLI